MVIKPFTEPNSFLSQNADTKLHCSYQTAPNWAHLHGAHESRNTIITENFGLFSQHFVFSLPPGQSVATAGCWAGCWNTYNCSAIVRWKRESAALQTRAHPSYICVGPSARSCGTCGTSAFASWVKDGASSVWYGLGVSEKVTRCMREKAHTKCLFNNCTANCISCSFRAVSASDVQSSSTSILRFRLNYPAQ